MKTISSSIKLLKIFVGMPQYVTMHGIPTYTAILKKEVKGPVTIFFDGPEGNKPAVHPDAVYAIPYSHYSYWAKKLSNKEIETDWACFGENLILDGIDEENLRIGDLITIGKTVKFIVVSPRIPCDRLAWRLGEKETFLREFAISGKTGFYFKVIQEGVIVAGDTAVHVSKSQNGITVAELSRLIANVNDLDENQIQTILSQEHLGISATEILQRRIAAIQDSKLLQRGRWKGWRSFCVDEIVEETNEIKSFWLRPNVDGPIAGFRPGQFLTCRPPELGDKSWIRTWTLSHFDPMGNRYRISVKKIPNGIASSFLHDQIQVGNLIEVKPPNGSFVLDRSTPKPIILISAGIGITPMVAMLRAHLQRDLQPYSNLYFVFVTRNSQSFPFRKEIEELTKGKERVKTLVFFTKPLSDDHLGRDYDVKGRFLIDSFEPIMEGNQTFWGNKWHNYPKNKGFFYLCGPQGFQDTVKKDLIDWGVRPSTIFTESFHQEGGLPVGVKAERAEVVFSKSGIVARWSEDEDLTLLDLAEKHDIDDPFACRQGVCRTCRCSVKEGKVFYEQRPTVELEDHFTLLCMAKPSSERIVLDL